jgi:hypothetical protein
MTRFERESLLTLKMPDPSMFSSTQSSTSRTPPRSRNVFIVMHEWKIRAMLVSRHKFCTG